MSFLATLNLGMAPQHTVTTLEMMEITTRSLLAMSHSYSSSLKNNINMSYLYHCSNGHIGK